jgi:hypothetical protein
MPKLPWLVVEIAAFIALLCIPAMIFTNYANLPPEVQTQIGFGAPSHRLNDKSMLVFFLVAASSVYALLSAAPFNSDLIGPPGKPKTRRIESAIAMIRMVKLEIMAFLAYLVWTMIEIPKGNAVSLGHTPIIFVTVLLGTFAVGLFTTTRNAH